MNYKEKNQHHRERLTYEQEDYIIETGLENWREKRD